MNEWPKNEGVEYKIGVKEALESGRVGFEDISVEGTEQLFQEAPKGQVFIVPDDRFATTYSERAKALGREDIEFKVEEKE